LKSDKTTTIGDLVLIYFENAPAMFARIEDIHADARPGWYHVDLLMLQRPIQITTWILRDAYIGGAEFTMDGHRIRLEKVISPKKAGLAAVPRDPEKPKSKSDARVISFNDLKRP
jgi:hypothetical protein